MSSTPCQKKNIAKLLIIITIKSYLQYHAYSIFGTYIYIFTLETARNEEKKRTSEGR